jgi:hypothetical protein
LKDFRDAKILRKNSRGLIILGEKIRGAKKLNIFVLTTPGGYASLQDCL